MEYCTAAYCLIIILFILKLCLFSPKYNNNKCLYKRQIYISKLTKTEIENIIDKYDSLFFERN